jgi:hypothetical protein
MKKLIFRLGIFNRNSVTLLDRYQLQSYRSDWKDNPDLFPRIKRDSKEWAEIGGFSYKLGSYLSLSGRLAMLIHQTTQYTKAL